VTDEQIEAKFAEIRNQLDINIEYIERGYPSKTPALPHIIVTLTGHVRDRLNELEAAFAARPAEPVAVKGLLWSKRGDDWYAETHVGQYAVGLVHGSFITMLRGIMDGHMHDLRLEQQPFHSAEEAKASAQADYEQRIRSALISTPAPGLVEALKQSRKLLAWAADSFAAQAKCSKIPDEIDALVGSEVMYRDAAKTVAEALSITETGGAKE
jgi:hypothetical protein